MSDAKWWQILLSVFGGLALAVAIFIFAAVLEQSGIAEKCYTGMIGGQIAVVCPPSEIVP